MTPAPRPRRIEREHARPRFITDPTQPLLDAGQRGLGLGAIHARRGLADQRCRRLPKRARLDRLLDRDHVAVIIQRDAHRHPTAARRRANFRPIDLIKAALAWDRGGEAEDLAGVKGGGHSAAILAPPLDGEGLGWGDVSGNGDVLH